MENRVFCLYRVSTDKQVDHNDRNQADIPMQRKACHRFAAEKGWTIVFEEQEDGVSGYKVRAENRDKVQLIRDYAKRGKFDILLVYMFDRIGRISDETPFVVEWFARNGIQIWSTQEGEQRFDSHTDKLTNYIRFWQADGESQKTSMRTKTAMGQMVEEGRFRGGIAPYGYRLVKSGILNKRKHEVCKLEIDEEESAVVNLMFNLCIDHGYGKWRIKNYLNEHGIKNRSGENWHDATVGHILHNILYVGIIKSGEKQSELIPEIQIICAQRYEQAQTLMLTRTNERNEMRTMPLNTTGQSLMSGNIFCGHCGGRLVITTSGKPVHMASGETVRYKRIRYVCYNKTRQRRECDGQTGYTMHILDDMVTKIIHEVFNKMRGASSEDIVGSAFNKKMCDARRELQKAKNESTKASKDYGNIKGELLKALSGESCYPEDILKEMLTDAQARKTDSEKRTKELEKAIEEGNTQIAEIQAEYNKIFSWSEIFDDSTMEVKKMIAGYLIKKITVYRDYNLDIKFNLSIEQFLNGLEFEGEERQPLMA